jgi:hypothetical protein
MLRRAFAGLAAVAMAATLGMAAAPAAHAEDWCDADPLVKVVTPGGSKQNVHLTLFALGETHRKALQRAEVSSSTTRAADGGTDVTITVTVPQDESRSAFPTKAVVSTQPHGKGAVLASKDDGKAGAEMRLVYSLNVA